MIQLDKKAHFLAGIALSAMTLPFGFVAACVVPAVIGLMKEVVDPYIGGTRDAADFAWTIAGGVAFVGWISLLARVMP